MESGSLKLLETSGPHRACYGTALPVTAASDAKQKAPRFKVLVLTAFIANRSLKLEWLHGMKYGKGKNRDTLRKQLATKSSGKNYKIIKMCT
jgi:hypothetical protein